MPAVLVLAVERSVTEWGTPATEAIQDAIARGSLSYGRPSERVRDGDWLAPAARVTRNLERTESIAGGDSAHWYVTRAADVYGLPEYLVRDEDAMAYLLLELIRRCRAELDQATGGEWDVRVDPFEESIHGPLEWWVSGEAVHSPHWQSQFPYVGEGDNPIGPNRGDQGSDPRIAADDWIQAHDPTNANFDLGLGGLDTDKLLKTLTWIGGGALLLFLVYQWWQASKASKASKEEAA